MYANQDDREVDKLTSKFPAYEEAIPVNEPLQRELISLSRNNFLAYSLSAESQITDLTFSRTFLQDMTMPIKFWIENRTLGFDERRKQLRSYFNNLVERLIIAVDFDPVNNRVIMIIRSKTSYFLFMRHLLDNVGSSIIFFEIKTSEPMLLDVKFFCPFNQNVIVILGLARCYIVELPQIEMNQLSYLNLDSFGVLQNVASTQKNPNVSSKFLNFGNELNYFGSNLSQVRISRIFPNINFTNVSVSKGSSYIIFWSRLSKNLQVHNVATKETFWLAAQHFFDTVEVSNASFEKILCYSRTTSIGYITIFNLKTQHRYLITVRRNRVQDFFEMLGQQVDPNYISSSEYIEAAFSGHQDNVVVLVNGCLLFFTNKSYDKDYLDSHANRMQYTFNNIFSLRKEISLKVFAN